MDAVQIHLAINHLPVFSFLIALPLVIIARLRDAGRGILFALGMVYILGCVAAILSLFSGEGAVELIADRSGVFENAIWHHEEVAERALWVILISGIVSLALLVKPIRKKVALSKVRATVMIIVATIVFFITLNVNHTGGLIRHPELNGEKAVVDGETYEDEDEEALDTVIVVEEVENEESFEDY